MVVSACAVTYGSCEGDINWEALVSFHSFVCVLLGTGMEFVVSLNTSLMNPATRGGFSLFTAAGWQTGGVRNKIPLEVSDRHCLIWGECFCGLW